MQACQIPPVFRFAPSPNGHLHLGHAYSALLNQKLARGAGGKLLLRIEDVDRQRSRAEFEASIFTDLAWLGITFDEFPRRQSDHLPQFEEALDNLISRGLAYPSFVSRSDIAALAAQNANWPRDPDGAFLPPAASYISEAKQGSFSIRLNMKAALAACSGPIGWRDGGLQVYCDAASWGDIILKSRDGSFAYHLAVVIDDAAQNITNIVRGHDLYAATSIHRVLQNLLKLPQPDYHHHKLILDQNGGKLAKSNNSPSLCSLRQEGLSPIELRHNLGFSA